MFSGVTLSGTGNNVLQSGRSGIFTIGKDFLILTVDKSDHLFTGEEIPLRVVLQNIRQTLIKDDENIVDHTLKGALVHGLWVLLVLQKTEPLFQVIRYRFRT